MRRECNCRDNGTKIIIINILSGIYNIYTENVNVVITEEK